MQFKKVLKLLFLPTGATYRIPFFLGYVGIYLLTFICMMAYSLSTNYIFTHVLQLDENIDHDSAIALISTVVIGIFGPLTSIFLCLLLLWSHLCLIMKRLRDLQLSAWLVILPYLTSVSIWLIHVLQLMKPGKYDDLTISRNIALVVYIVFLIMLFLWPSRRKLQSYR